MGNAFDKVWLGNLVTMKNGAYHTIEQGALAVTGQYISWVGPVAELPASQAPVEDLGHAWITPGFIDCHTHLVFGGNRADEFEMRLKGASYEEIARAGGGILSTVRHTREADEDSLYASALRRLKPFIAEGVTTLEIKSGYGLDTENELKMLRVARRLGESLPIRILTTFLGAHALHPEYEDRTRYIDLICEEMMPRVAEEHLADAVDAFCENIAFTLDEVRRVFEAARKYKLPVKLHADQLSDGGGAALAAEFGAMSADHVEYTGEAGIEAMAGAGTVAVLLPGAWYTLREEKLPDIEGFRKHGVPMALASDANPGSSPVLSLRTMLGMGCTSFRMTPEEALAGVTIHAAKALGCDTSLGSLEPGKLADFLAWDISTPAELAYWLGGLQPILRHKA